MSDLRVSTISDLAGTGPATLTKQSAAKAWVNFNGTGTVNVRGSFNNSSITDSGTGIYRLTRAASMANLNSIVPNANCEENAGGYNRSATATTTDTSYSDVRFFNTGTNVLFDGEYGYLSINGDLA